VTDETNNLAQFKWVRCITLQRILQEDDAKNFHGPRDKRVIRQHCKDVMLPPTFAPIALPLSSQSKHSSIPAPQLSPELLISGITLVLILMVPLFMWLQYTLWPSSKRDRSAPIQAL
jgi:hypothetical protein